MRFRDVADMCMAGYSLCLALDRFKAINDRMRDDEKKRRKKARRDAEIMSYSIEYFDWMKHNEKKR